MSVIETPYHRTISTYPDIVFKTTYNYTPYEIFKIKTKISHKIRNFLGIDISILFVSEKRDNMMANVVKFEKIGENGMNKTVVLSEIQYNTIKKWINDSIVTYPQHALITYSGFNEINGFDRISNGWILSMMKYVSIKEKYDPFIKDEGIYVCFKKDHSNKYNKIIKSIVEQLKNFYINGYVVGAQHIAKSWNLMEIDYNEYMPRLYAPDWKDSRFAKNMVDFLLKRISGDNIISIEIEQNDVKKHCMAVYATKNNIEFYITDTSFNFYGNNLEDTRKITSSIYNIGHDVVGQVITFYFPRYSWVYLHKQAINEIYGESETIWYYGNDPSRQYCLSCLFDINISEPLERQKIIQKVNILYFKYNYDPNRPKDISVHDWLEFPESSPM